jgi:ROK family
MNVVHNLRHHNRSRILRLIAERGSLSRAEIAGLIGVSKVTITTIVNELVASSWLVESAKTEGATGRPAGLVELNPKGGTVIGLDAQPDRIRWQVSDLNASAETSSQTNTKQTRALKDPADCTAALLDLLETLDKRASHGALRQVVIAVPAPVTPAGELGQPSRLPALNSLALRQWGERRGVQLSFENDVKLAALAEFERGAAQTQANFALLTEREGAGVALGLFLDGQLYRGHSGRAGELALIAWSHGGRQQPLEDLPIRTRELALAQVCSALAVALDLGVFLVHQNARGAATLDVARRVREFVLRPIEVIPSRFGDDGPLLGAVLQAARLAKGSVFSNKHA